MAADPGVAFVAYLRVTAQGWARLVPVPVAPVCIWRWMRWLRGPRFGYGLGGVRSHGQLPEAHRAAMAVAAGLRRLEAPF